MAGYAVGLTGGIASGKTAVSRMFETRGVAVVDADIAARDAVALGSSGLAALVEAFGAGILASDGQLDRRAMRERVFGDEDARRSLEAIVHPRVRAALQAGAAAAHGPYAVVAIPLLAEGGGRGAYPWLDRVLVVDVPVEVQHARLTARDGIDDALATRMIGAQATRAQRLAIADDVLANAGPLAALEEAIVALDARYRTLAALRGGRP